MKFNPIEPLVFEPRFLNDTLGMRGATAKIIEIGERLQIETSSIPAQGLTVAEARQLYDWLSRALPPLQ